MLIGLTGGIASGKSSVSAMLKKIGHPVIDADQIAREVVEQGETAYRDIVSHFGHHILDEQGNIERKKLGAIIFDNEQERQVLNQIVHPAVRKRMQQKKDYYVNEGYQTIIFDIPLLYESNLFHLVDKVLLVYVDPDVQFNRLEKRDQAGKEDAQRRIKSQIPLKEKRKRADAIIDNNGSLDETRQQLEIILQKWNVDPPR
ncbi:dephospho-CoA kinase [Halalkalibacter urbisdiaboli]|uniref:dephospho-CoA kinase n=1 Tax=Halalkalibacter urbisdiaboli TaxID=1960589 RepID=UPI000B43A9DA|nr:dephospho-CoA kinase [Halalkalibacter urbisdiaboli]